MSTIAGAEGMRPDDVSRDERADAAALQDAGKALLLAFHAAAQALRLYPIENETVQHALDELRRSATALFDLEQMANVRIADDFVFLNDVRLRMELSTYGAISQVRNLFSRHLLGEIDIDRDVERPEWAAFLALLLAEPPAAGSDDDPAAPYLRFRDRLDASPVRRIRVAMTQPSTEQEEEDDENLAKEAAKRTYVQSVQVARHVLTDTRLGKAVSVRRVKRAVQAIVDQVLRNEQLMLGMTTLRDFDEYTFTHCVNVCIFSVILGQKLGLSKLQLYELGMGALFHDVGKQRVGAELVQKEGGLTEEEWHRMQRHPTDGMLALFSMHGFGEGLWRAMLMAYEHHMRVDLSGYPKNRRPRSPTLFSRIVAVADGFEAGTARRSYQRDPPRAELVLQEMRDNPKRGYDALLVKALINVTGIFPVGTLVILDTHELGLVYAANPDPVKLHQPMVKVISDGYGRPLGEPALVDLSAVDEATGLPARTIIKTTDPARYGIRIGDYFA